MKVSYSSLEVCSGEPLEISNSKQPSLLVSPSKLYTILSNRVCTLLDQMLYNQIIKQEVVVCMVNIQDVYPMH